MNRIVILLALGICLLLGTQAHAIDLGLGIFKKKPETTPAKNDTGPQQAQPVRALMTVLQTEADVAKRKLAAEELRMIDPRTSPEVIGQLVASMQKDPSPIVRAASAESLGSIKFVYPIAGAALEAVEKSDTNSDVRAAAKAALWQYSLNGYRLTSPEVGQSAEPPLSRRRPSATTIASAPETPFRPISQGIGNGAFYQQTGEPPLAKAKIPPSAPATRAPQAQYPETNPPRPSTTLTPPTVTPPTIPTVPSIPSGVPTISSPPIK